MSEWNGKIEDLINADQNEFEKAMSKARDLSWKIFGKNICFYAPSFTYYKNAFLNSSYLTFPSISVTGSFCALNCKHCGGRLLKDMIPALTPKRLIEICAEIKGNGGMGCLISGGCQPNGAVPLGKYLNAISEIKQKFGLKIVVHTGLVDFEFAQRLKESGVDAALLDVIGSNETIKEVYQLKATLSDYETSLSALQRVGIAVVPHILVGLHHGRLLGEFQAIQMISKYSPSAVVVISIMPLRGTVMQNLTVPSPQDIAKILVMTRLMLPKTPLALGCMRTKGNQRAEIDSQAVKMGVNAIAFPDFKAVQLAESIQLEAKFSALCCSQIFEEAKPVL